jgi:hypothetical protein
VAKKMNNRILLISIVLFVFFSFLHRTAAQALPSSNDPLRHGHALLIGISQYADRYWPPLDDVPLQLNVLKEGLKEHFDTVEIAPRDLPPINFGKF